MLMVGVVIGTSGPTTSTLMSFSQTVPFADERNADLDAVCVCPARPPLLHTFANHCFPGSARRTDSVSLPFSRLTCIISCAPPPTPSALVTALNRARLPAYLASSTIHKKFEMANGEAAIAGLKVLLKLHHDPHPWDDFWMV